MRLIKKLLLRVLTVLVIIILTQSAVISISISRDNNPLRPPETDSPRQTMSAFMDNMNKAYTLIKEAEKQSEEKGGLLWHSPEVKKKGKQAQLALNRAIDALNLVDIPPINRQDFGTEYALMLKEILDRLELPKPDEIPDEKVVPQSLTRPRTRWEVPGSEIAIELVEEGFNVNEYLFTPETVKRIREFYESIKGYEYNKSNYWKISRGFYRGYITTPGYLLPPKWSRWLPRGRYAVLLYDQTLWQWFSLAIMTLVVFATIFGVEFLLKRYIKTANSYKKVWLGLFIPALTLWMTNFWEFIIDEHINITGAVLENLLKLSTIVEGGVWAWFAFMVLNAIGWTIISNMPQGNTSLEAVIVRNGFRLLGVLTGLTVFYTTSKEIGIAAEPIIASFGISGIAIGLGVKPYIENLVGGLTLFLNRPIKIGDFCELGGVIGTVEDIGLRSTLIRTPDRKLIYVPNTVVSTSQIVNHSQRDKYSFKRTLSLSYDSAHEELGETMENLRNILAQHPKLSEERISLGSLSHEIIDVDIFAYILTRDVAQSLLIQEEILLKISHLLDITGAKVVALTVSNTIEYSHTSTIDNSSSFDTEM
ncbi:mechanosensitive ion channel family protein [Okeania sp. SIO1I7]|uniref:mechanosensitive ion channel family protein n=1 Tax=Okeania sp. SIO1I7 TaxID=2607772 RepID=UPI0013FCB0E1|nr:mechanosensitive ion channel domain-containing protein [Okeania sp. SIO1I7]NET28540.1 mechanosensitive ion channel [Okeania sp. SIO1I7]